MSLTVGKLKELLSALDDDMIIVDEQNREIVHIHISDECRLSVAEPIGICVRSGGYVYPSLFEGYDGFSPEVDEELFACEINYDMSEMREE